MGIKELCELHGLDYKKVVEYRKEHRKMSPEQLVEHCKKYAKYKAKQDKPKSMLEQACEYYYLDIKTVKAYKSRHPELTEQQIIEYYIHRNNRDLKLLLKKLYSINGVTSIRILGLDTRTYNAIRRLGVSTVEQLKYVPICILRNNIYNIGEKSLQNIIQSCNKLGIQLREY